MKKLLLVATLVVQPLNIFNDTGLKYQDDTLLLDYEETIIVDNMKTGETFKLETAIENKVTLMEDESQPGVFYIKIEKKLDNLK